MAQKEVKERRKWEFLADFEQYRDFKQSWFFVQNTTAGYFTCSCKNGLKLHRCLHSIGVEILYQGFQVPPECSSQEIGKKRKKGRPAKEPGFHKGKTFYKKRKQ